MHENNVNVYKLKDYKALPENHIYRFDNLCVVWTGEMLLSKYPQETMWYPWDTSDQWFRTWEERELTDTGKIYWS